MSSFEEEFKKKQEERQRNSGGGDWYKFTVGEHQMRIMSRPVLKESRFGHGICYPGAKYCDPVEMQKEFEEKIEAYNGECEKARQSGASDAVIKKIKKPSRPNTSVKYVVWAIIRKSGDLALVELPESVTGKIVTLKADKDMGTDFEEFPMPYDVKIVVSRKKVANPGPKDIEYSLIAGQKRTDPTPEELVALEKKTTVQQILERQMAKKQAEDEGRTTDDSGPIEYPEEESNVEDIPF